MCKIGFVERNRILATLKEHEGELRRAGVFSLSVFGSVARGESPAHDVDIAVRLGGNFSARVSTIFAA
jgi:hypothetical protein